MKKAPFYLLINKLYLMSFKNYLYHIRTNVLSQEWFKKACKEKKIKIKYLTKNFFIDEKKNSYLMYEDETIYFFKLFILKFEYQEELENNNHLKLLNINIKNETILNIVELLFSLQKLYLKTNYYQDITMINRKKFIIEYDKRFGSYMDLSILSKIFNNTLYFHRNNIHKLTNLIPKENLLYSLYIKDLINSDAYSLKGDSQISKILFSEFGIKISRRTICYIRNKYLIPKVQKKNDFYFYLCDKKFYGDKKILSKQNVSSLENNLNGIYELSSDKLKKYPFSQNNIIYIGSSKNLKKRLWTYTSENAHTKNIRDFIKENEEIYFRIIKTINYKEFEMKFMNAFIDMNGELPKLNKQRVLNIDK